MKRLFFIPYLLRNAGAGEGEGGGAPTSESIQKALGELKAGIEKDLGDQMKKDMQLELAEQLKSVNEQIEALKGIKPGATAEELKAATDAIEALKEENKTLLKAFNMLQTRVKAGGVAPGAEQKKSFGEALAEAAEANMKQLEQLTKGKNSVILDLKSVGNMTLGSNLSGDSVATYNSRQGLVPSQKLNLRELVPTVQSDTGLYVTYRETGSEGGIAVQTEGADKSQIDYDLTEVKVVNNYIAGYATFSKQMLKSLPFMQTTLTRMLLRDFYKQENATFFRKLYEAATGSSVTNETVDIKQIIDYIANQETANFNASFVLVSHTEAARIKKYLLDNTHYLGSGSVVGLPNGSISVSGTPIIPASWVTDDKALVVDNDMVERVEVEGLRVEFSYENDKNFQKNLVTARVECYEEMNILRPDSLIFADLGNVAS